MKYLPAQPRHRDGPTPLRYRDGDFFKTSAIPISDWCQLHSFVDAGEMLTLLLHHVLVYRLSHITELLYYGHTYCPHSRIHCGAFTIIHSFVKILYGWHGDSHGLNILLFLHEWRERVAEEDALKKCYLRIIARGLQASGRWPGVTVSLNRCSSNQLVGEAK